MLIDKVNRRRPQVIATDESIKDASSFVMERHLEDLLVANWERTDLGRDYDLYKVDGEIVGRLSVKQFQTAWAPAW